MERYCHVCGRQFSETEENKAMIGQGKCPYCGASLATPDGQKSDGQKPDGKSADEKRFGKASKKGKKSGGGAQSDIRYLRVLGRRKVLFVLAFVGLLLDFVYGIGAVLCLPVAVFACRDLFFLHKRKGKPSTQLVWAAVVGGLGGVLGVIFFVLML